MNKNLDLIAKELFSKLRTQFPKIRLGDANSERTDRPKDARFFEFDFIKNGKNLGTISISIDDNTNADPEGEENDGLVVMYSNDIVEGQPDGVKHRWFRFLESLSDFASSHMMDFNVRDIAKSNLDKRDYKMLANNSSGEGTMTESKLWGTSRTSFQEMGEAKLIVRHSKPVNYDLPAGRTMHIESIFVENADGERFKYPYKHLNGARALATHVAHGGTSYDNIGQHIIGLSEELNKLRMFKGYVNRNPIVSEAMGTINEKVFERIDQVKKEIHSLQSPNFYKTFAESWTDKEDQLIPEDVVNDWIDRLTIRSFNEELKNVFPYIYKLVGEEVNVVKELTAEDLLNDGYNPNSVDAEHRRSLDQSHHDHLKSKAEGPDASDRDRERYQNYLDKKERMRNDYDDRMERESLNIEDAFESFLNGIVGEESALLNVEDSQEEAIKKLNDLVSNEMPIGTDGTNAIQSLKGIIDDKELADAFRELGQVNPEMDAREILKGYLQKRDEENGTDIASKINFDSTAPAPTVAPEAPAAAAPTPPVAEGMGNDVEEFLHKVAQSGDNGYDMLYNAQRGKYGREIEQAVQDMYDDITIDTGYHGDDDFEQIYDRMMDNIQHDYGQQDVAEEKEDPPFDGPYKKPGDNKDQFGNTVKNPARHAAKKGMAAAIAKAKKAGATAETMVNFGSGEMSLGEAITKAGMDIEEFFEGAGKQNEVVEFVKSMYDETTGRFPKGETGVMIAVEKEFGEDAARIAHGLISELSHVYESNRLRELAGVGEGARWRDPKYKDKFYTQDPVADDEDDFYYDSDYYGKSRPENDPGKKQRMGGIGSEFGDNDDPMSGRYTIRKTHMPHEFDGEYTSSAFSTRGPRKGMITKQHGRNMKDKIRGSLGTHNEPNLPESAELAAMLKIAGLR
jgi:hypothetical protein